MSIGNLMITESDSRQLRMLLENSMTAKEHDRANWDALAKEVEAAQVVPCSEIPSDVVTMHSRVRIVDLRTGEQRVFQVVYPRDANFAENKISVLAPIGTALLGYPAGTEITWAVPSGTRRLRIEAVEQQPQATSSKRCA